MNKLSQSLSVSFLAYRMRTLFWGCYLQTFAGEMVKTGSNVSQAAIKFLWSQRRPWTSDSPASLFLVLRSQACTTIPSVCSTTVSKPRAECMLGKPSHLWAAAPGLSEILSKVCPLTSYHQFCGFCGPWVCNLMVWPAKLVHRCKKIKAEFNQNWKCRNIFCIKNRLLISTLSLSCLISWIWIIIGIAECIITAQRLYI